MKSKKFLFKMIAVMITLSMSTGVIVSRSEIAIPDYAQKWTHPLKTNAYQPISGGTSFGASRDNGNRAHAAIDFVIKANTPVYAMTQGKVTGIYNFYEGTDAIEVLNDDGTTIRYGEIKAVSGIKVGSVVTTGQMIAKIIKNTSAQQSSMLHLEIYRGTSTGALTVNNSKYDYVPKANYVRRSDLVDPTFAQYLSYELTDTPVGVKTVDVSVPSTVLWVGQEVKANVLIKPVKATDKSVKWESDANKVVSVDKNGVLKAAKVGKASVTAKSSSNPDAESTVVLSVKELKVSILVPTQKQAKAYVARKKLLQLYKKYSLPKASMAEKWTSSDPEIAKVDNKGLVTARSVGTTVINVKLANGQSDSMKIKVVSKESLSKKVKIVGSNHVSVGATAKLQGKLDRLSCTDQLKWSSSNKDIASIDKSGKVSAKAKGKVKITVKTTGGKKDTFELNIK